MHVTLIYLKIYLLLNIDIIPGCKLLHMMLKFWYLNVKFIFTITAYEGPISPHRVLLF